MIVFANYKRLDSDELLVIIITFYKIKGYKG
jgi:hypothetical protein